MRTQAADTNAPKSETADRRRRLVERVEQLRREASRLAGRNLPAIHVAFDLAGTAAGRCLLSGTRWRPRVTIRFNRLSLTCDDLFRNAMAETAPHEVAHAVVMLGAGPPGRPHAPHGPEWRALCRALGGSGDTTHRLPLPRAKTLTEYEYRVDGKTPFWLGPVRHRRLQSGERRYLVKGRPIDPSDHTGRKRRRR